MLLDKKCKPAHAYVYCTLVQDALWPGVEHGFLRSLVLEMVLPRRIGWLSIILYLGMGWLIVIAGKPLLVSMATGGLILLVVGGLFYSLGVIFYAWKSLSYHLAVWRLFVLTGSVAHFFAILLYVYSPA